MYQPMRVGAFQDSETWHTEDGRVFLRDDEGDNISSRNASYCELTAMYRILHGMQAEAYGLCHYRRYFAGKRTGDRWKRILTQAQLEAMLSRADVILPPPRHYWIQTNWQQYAHAHHEKDLLVTQQVLQGMPDARYATAFASVMQRRSGHRMNLFVMKAPVFRAYAEWLFSVLFQVERQLDLTGYSAEDRRVFGYLAERLLDVWLTVNPQTVLECQVVHMEKQHWPRKLTAFLLRAIRPAK